MPRDGSGVASPVAGTNTASSGTVIQSTLNNSNVNDIYQLMNTAWPVSLGGTGGTTQITSWDALSARGTDVATAATVNLTTATGPDVNLTGTTTITAITLADKDLRFARAVTGFSITASATLVVNGQTAGTFALAAEDRLLISGYGSSTVRVTRIGGSLFPNGTAALPSISFVSDDDTGIYHIGANEIGLALGGALKWDFTTTALLPADGTMTIGGSFNKLAGINLAGGASVTWDPAGSGVTLTSFGNSLVLQNGAGSGGLIVKGNLDLTNLGGGNGGVINFPASPNLSANVNTLDEYTEFTWTPALQIGGAATGITYTSRSGTGTKIGNHVTEHFNLVLSANGALTGTVSVTGSAYTVPTLASVGGVVGLSSNFTGLTGALCIDKNGTTYRPYQSGSTGGSQLSQAVLTATTSLRAGTAHSTST